MGENTARFHEHPETITGDVSQAFIDFAKQVHPGQPYDSATAALMCRQAYDLGRKEGKPKRTKPSRWGGPSRLSQR